MRQQLWDKTAIIFAVGIFLTFVAFDEIWCMDTTFASFSFFETYATKIIATLALAGVYALTRCRWAQIVVMALLDVLLVANLMYFRTTTPPSRQAHILRRAILPTSRQV